MKEKIKTDLIKALKAHKMFVVGVLRFLLSEIKNEEINKRRALNDNELINLLQSQLKKREESVGFFIKGARQDLVDKEQKEIDLIKTYLPKPFSENEIRKKVRTVIAKATNSEKSNFGLLMGKLMKDLKGKVNGQTVSQILKEEVVE